MDNRQRATEAPTSQIYWGTYAYNLNWDIASLTTFETDAKKKVSIAHWYQPWGVTDMSKSFQPSWMDQARNHGSIPMVTWEPWDWTKTKDQPDYQLADIINGNYDSYITAWAQASKAWGKPYFLRFAHEMNGDWTSWSEKVNGNSQGQYIAAWRHVHDIFTQNGVTNVTWVWCPNIIPYTVTPMDQVYPGDNYVDWTCLDGYNWGTKNSGNVWKSFTNTFLDSYNQVLQIAPNKPVMIGEFSSSEIGGSKADWITSALQTEIPQTFPKIKAIVWFNINKEDDWRIESSPTAQSAFATGIASPYYATNTFATLQTSPIQPLEGLAQTPSVSPSPNTTIFPTPTIAVVTNTPTSVPPTPTKTGDTTLPTVSIISPPDGSNIPRKTDVKISATASDNVAIAKVLFYQNNTLLCSSLGQLSLYSCSWKMPAKTGVYTLTVKAYDTNNNTSSKTIQISSK